MLSWITLTKHTMPPFLSAHQPFVPTELEDGIARSFLFHFLELHSLSPSLTAHLQLISLMLSITSTLIFLETIPPTPSLSLPQLDLDQESSSIDEMDTQSTALITDMNPLMSITPLPTLTLSTNSIGLLLDESSSPSLAALILLALQLSLSTEP